MVSQFVATV